MREGGDWMGDIVQSLQARTNTITCSINTVNNFIVTK